MTYSFTLTRAPAISPASTKPLASLRFFAVLWVVLYSYIGELKLHVHFGLIDDGYLGIDLLVVLSGFLLGRIGFDAVAQRRSGLQPSLVVTLLSGVVLIALYIGLDAMGGFPVTHAALHWGVLRLVPAFLIGAVLDLARRAGAVDRPAIAMAAAMAAGLILVAAGSYSRADVVIVIACGLLVLAMSGLGRDGTGILSSPVFVYLGKISLSALVVYMPWKWIYPGLVNGLLGTRHAPMPFIWWVAGLLALVPISMLLHHLIEVPCRGLVRRFGEKILVRFGPKFARQG